MKLHSIRQQISWLLFGFIFTLAFHLHAQRDDIQFRHLSIEEGLSQSYAICIIQDDNGFIWIGTVMGLNKYDGYTFKVYESDADNPHSLSNSYIRSMCKDRNGILWIGTESGLNRYDSEKDQFTRYLNNPNDSNSLSENWAYSICEDRSGEIWIGTNGGLNRFNQKKNQFVRYKADPDNLHSISSNRIRSIYQDSYGVVWIGTENGGLNKFDREKEQFICYKHIPDDPTSLSNNTVLSICEDNSGILWIGTYGGGLNKFDRKKEQFVCYRNIPGNPTSLSDDYINVIYEDKSGVLWIGTENGGVNIFNRQKEQFLSYQKNPDDPHSLSHNRVLSIYEDNYSGLWVGTRGGGINLFYRAARKFKHYRTYPNNPNSLNDNMVWQIYEDNDGIIWIGTDNGGLNKFDRKKNTFTHYMHNPDDPNSISYNRVTAICEDKSDVLWIGTYRGVNKFNRETEQFIHYKHDPNDPTSLSYDKIICIYEDRSGVLWIGTKGGGLNKFDRETEQFIYYKHDPNNPHSLSHNKIYHIYEDRSDILWIGTNGGGLNKFDKEKEQFIHYKSDPSNPNSISDNSIFSIYEDRSGVLWIGTFGQGLNKFNRKKNIFTRFTKKDGLPDNTIYNILEDDNGNLWLSTNNGISMFNIKTGKFKNYDVNDGLQSNEFNGAASCKSKSGEMFFGGINGFNVFFPDSIRDNPHIPPIVITDLLIFNKTVPIGKTSDGRSILERSITETKEIALSYRDNVFSFEFAALHYVSPDNNQYAYMMEGLEKGWNYVGSSRRYVTYTSLPPGEYIFKVKGSNSDGVWNEEGTSLKITVTPPFWKTWWFYLLCAIVIIISAWVAYKNHITRLKKHELEITLQERTQEILERKKSENALKTEKGYLDQLFESAREAIVMSYENHRVRRVNSEFTRLFGYTQDEAVGQLIDDLIAPKELIEEADSFTKSVTEGNIINFESIRQRKDGTLIHVSVIASPIIIDNKQVGVYGIYRDITERKRAEEEKRQLEEQFHQAQKMEAIGELAGGVAHDFNNMLTAISGFAGIIKNKFTANNPALEKYISRIIDAASRSADLTAKLLAFARKGKYKVVVVDIHSIIQTVIGLLEHTIDKRINIIQHLNTNHAIVMGDNAQLQNAVLNIAVNSLDAMPYGGELKFITDIVDLDKKYIDSHPSNITPGTYLRLSVTDTGTGMDEKTKARIFEPFFTTKEPGKGTGLGLASVYGIIESHNGSIEVECEVGKGTTFKIHLPLANKHFKEIRDIPEKLQNGSGNILIVDDEELIREMAEEMLTDLGYTIATCNDGEEAVEYYKKHYKKIDLLILDLMMPKLSGYDCFVELKKINPNVRVIVSSGYSIDGEARKILDEGTLGFVKKPFEINELAKAINEAMNKHSIL